MGDGLRTRRVTPVSSEDDPILTMTECARRFGKTQQTVGRWIQEGLLECVKMPSGLRGVRQSAVNRFLGVVHYKKIE